MINLKLIQQGAEAKIFLDKKDNLIIKDRTSKSYRIPELDKTIRKRRTRTETKLLEKANKIIDSPKPLTESNETQIIIPFIDGKKLSQYLDSFPLEEQKEIMKSVGKNIALLHKNNIIHGDLTTSNMIIIEDKNSGIINNSASKRGDNLIEKSTREKRSKLAKPGRAGGKNIPKNFRIFFIDFGLGYISLKTEDKAVDLHLLKQALEAKHFVNWKILYDEMQKSYSKNLGKEESKKVFERITAVERRGRYRH